MKYLILMLLTFSVQAGIKPCASWDTFCKSPPQIVATKCRLGVPVNQVTCDSLGYGDYSRRNGGLVVGLPVSEMELNKTTDEILNDYI